MNQSSKSVERYLILYVPWIISLLLKSDAILSYFAAWLGTFFIFFICYSGWLKPLPTDRAIAAQLMRPVFIVQIVFVGYMSCSSIFYFLNLLGVNDLTQSGEFFTIDKTKLELAANCQRYYVLGHAAFTTGIVWTMRYPIKQQYKIDSRTLANLLLIIAVISFPLSVLADSLSGFGQFSGQFSSLSFIAGTLALAFAIPLKKTFNTLFCLFLYFSNFYHALTSGFKEPIIISVLVLGIFLYPIYKKIVIAIFVPALLLLFTFLPTYNSVFRQNNWSSNVDADDAYKIALEATIDESKTGDNSNWGFLVYRLSEIDMFTDFIKSTPDYVDYYGFDLVEQAGISVVPRIFWPSKPITEDLVMQRVYNAGVVMRGSDVSAKPAYIVDGYLSGGAFGVFLALLIFGIAAQSISQKAEQLFGGYVLGTALIFSGLFQMFWRGLSFEFLLNSVFWSYVTMILIQRVLKAYNIVQKI